MSGSGHYGRSGADQHLRKVEKEAYVAVLRAFTAQSEVITWRKEQLLVTLRQELRISDEQHLEVLKGMDSNAAPQQFRDRRLPEEEHGGLIYAPNVDLAAGARKKPKTSHNLQANLPPPPMKSAFPSPPPPPPPLVTSHAKRAPPGGGSRSKKSKGGRQHGNASSSKPVQFGEMPAADGSISGINPWVGKRVKIRWPADNSFYDAVVSDWDPEKVSVMCACVSRRLAEYFSELAHPSLLPVPPTTVSSSKLIFFRDLHALVYEMNTVNETWEWVDLKELSPNDLQTIDGPLVNVIGKNPPSFGVGGRGTTGRGTKKGAENGLDAKGSRQLQVPSLEALVKQVDRIAEEDDLAKIESIKRAAKEHEDMLRKALAEVGESSEEGESDEDNVPFSHTHSVECERERRSRQDSREQHGYDDEDDTAGDRDEGSDGEPMAAHGGVASDADDDHHDGDDWFQDKLEQCIMKVLVGAFAALIQKLF
ncbi:hypothetical protein L7F22_051830 [Adiantum nelumboides]|nr:hypothetical protein [Adiantum nelumboides]